jgi:hypothetical protein
MRPQDVQEGPQPMRPRHSASLEYSLPSSSPSICALILSCLGRLHIGAASESAQ